MISSSESVHSFRGADTICVRQSTPSPSICGACGAPAEGAEAVASGASSTETSAPWDGGSASPIAHGSCV
eukprot:1379403-Prymnesium_polylepis.2